MSGSKSNVVGAVLALAVLAGGTGAYLLSRAGGDENERRYKPTPELRQALEEAPEKYPDATKRKVVLLGMDSCDMEMLDRLIRQGKLPNFAKLKREGAYGHMEAVSPLISPVIWTTIATGMPPERHGILNFVTEVEGKNVPVSSRLRQADTMWEILARNEQSVGLVGWLVSYPTDPLPNAHLISDRMGLLAFEYGKQEVRDAENVTYPADLPERYKDELVTIDDMDGAYARRFVDVTDEEWGELYAKTFRPDNPVGNLRLTMATAERFRRMGQRMLEEEKPRFMAVYFEAMDALSHLFMPYAAPKMDHISDDDFRRFGGTMEANYRWHDEVLGEFMRMCDEHTTLMLVSDHGFKSGAIRMPESSAFHAKTGAQWHRMHGVFFAWGYGVAQGKKLTGVRVYDVAPTVLASMGFPRSKEMPGRVLSDAFKGGLEYDEIPHYYKDARRKELAELTVAQQAQDRDGLTQEDIEQIERLKTLGYIGGDTSDPATTSINKVGRMMRRGQFAQAIDALSAAIEKRDMARLRFMLAEAHLALRDLEAAQEAVDVGRAMDPEELHGKIVQTRVYLESKQLQKAHVQAVEVVSEKPHLPHVHALLAKVLEAEADVAEDAGDERKEVELKRQAILCYERSLEREPLQADALFHCARLMLAVTNDRVQGTITAAKYLTKCLELRPTYRKAHNNLAVARLRLGMMSQDAERSATEYRSALEAADAAIKLWPKYPTGWANKAYVLWKMGDMEKAHAAAQEARRFAPWYSFNGGFMEALKACGRELPPPAPKPERPEKETATVRGQ